jgi:hypothetical protein
VEILWVEETVHLFWLLFISEVDESGLVDTFYDDTLKLIENDGEVGGDIK